MPLRLQTLLSILISTLILTACGASTSSSELQNSTSPLNIQVENISPVIQQTALTTQMQQSLQLSSSDDFTITAFRLTLSSDALETPQIQEFDADIRELVLDALKPGDYTILLEAMNADGTVLKRRELHGIPVEAGVTSPVNLRLYTVPRFINLSDGASLRQSAQKLYGYAEIDTRLTIISEHESGESIEFSIVPERSGIFELSRFELPLGAQTLTLRDEFNQFDATLNIRVFPSESLQNRQILSSGDLSDAQKVGQVAQPILNK